MWFEVRSIAYVTAVNLLVIAIAFLIQWLRERDRCLLDWSIGFALGAVGSELSARRGTLPDWVVVAVGITLLMLIYVYTYIGLCRLLGCRPWRTIWLLPLLPLLSFSLHMYFILVDFRPGIWPMITGYMRVLVCGMIIVLLRRHRASMSPHAAALLQWSLLVMALFMLARGTMSVWVPNSGNFAESNAPAITYIVTAACTLAMMLGLLSLHVDQLLNKLERAANTDVLTGLRNRRRFNELAGSALSAGARNKQGLWLLMIDIDHFKQINDTFGHDAGDDALQRVGHTLRDTLRGGDIVARYGGEEFCILLPNTGQDAAHATAQRLLQRVAQLRVGPQNNHPVTISVGAAAQQEDDGGLDALLKRADRALYEAKTSGRNCAIGFEAAHVAAPVQA
ncbi:MAG: GGDEF domain-containing protein [Pseudomonadota bacterium]